MNSVIKFYECEINPTKNAIVEHIEQYLANKLIFQRTNFQYIKNALDVSIKIDINQDNISSFAPNYVSIKNDEENKIYYYFIINLKWLSTSTIAVELSLDTLNTFQEIEFSPKTQIVREIKQRSFYNENDNSFRNIDEIIEGVNFPKETIVNKKFNQDKDSLKWYLVTSTLYDLSAQDSNPDNPIVNYLVPSEPVKVRTIGGGTGEVTLYASEIAGGARYYYFRLEDNPNLKISASSHYLGEEVTFLNQLGATLNGIIKLFKIAREEVGGIPKIKYEFIAYREGAGGYGVVASGAVDSLTFTKANFAIMSNRDLFASYSLIQNLKGYKLIINAGVEGPIYSISIDDFNRSDSRLVKIIEMPYSCIPYNIDQIDGGIYFNDAEYKFGYFVINEGATYLNEIKEKVDLSPYLNVSYGFSIDEYDVDSREYYAYSMNKNINYESKLYSSEFFELKFMYDSFNYPLELERINIDDVERGFEALINIKFKMNSNIKSIFAFKFEFENDLAEYISNDDYPFFFVCDRNNEKTILNSNYINYLKNGYNFDKKQKEKEIGVATASIVTQIIGAIVSFASSVATGGVGVASGIALTTSAGVTIGNQIASLAQNEEARKTKRDELRAQSANVFNADDTDILNFYGGDKLKMTIHQVKRDYRNILFNLFYYTGYASNRVGVPYYKTMPQRLLFDYVQCNAVFENIEGYNSAFIEDLIQKFSIGVTIYHSFKKYQNSNLLYWDLTQTKANLDKWLIN